MCGASASCRKNSFSPGIVVDARGVRAAGQDVEAVQAQPERGVVGQAHGVPRPLVGDDLRAPRERLVGDAHAVRLGAVGEGVQLLGERVEVGDRVGRDRRSRPGSRSVPSSAITSNLRSARRRLRGEPLGRGGVEVAEGLVEVDRKAQVGAAAADLGGRERRGDEVRLEDLDAVEPGPGGRVELVLERAGDADGGQRGARPCGVGLMLGGRCRARGHGHGRPRLLVGRRQPDPPGRRGRGLSDQWMPANVGSDAHPGGDRPPSGSPGSPGERNGSRCRCPAAMMGSRAGGGAVGAARLQVQGARPVGRRARAARSAVRGLPSRRAPPQPPGPAPDAAARLRPGRRGLRRRHPVHRGGRPPRHRSRRARADPARPPQPVLALVRGAPPAARHRGARVAHRRRDRHGRRACPLADRPAAGLRRGHLRGRRNGAVLPHLHPRGHLPRRLRGRRVHCAALPRGDRSGTRVRRDGGPHRGAGPRRGCEADGAAHRRPGRGGPGRAPRQRQPGSRPSGSRSTAVVPCARPPPQAGRATAGPSARRAGSATADGPSPRCG